MTSKTTPGTARSGTSRASRKPRWQFASLAPGGSGRRVAVWVLVAASIGAWVGLGLTLLRPLPPPTATTAIVLLPDTSLPGQPDVQAPSPDRFIQNELFILNGQDLAAEVARQLKSTTLPTFSVVQVGATDVVQVSASAASEQLAARSAAALVSVYQERRRDALVTRVNGSLNVVKQQLESLAAVTQSAADSSSAQQSAARSEYGRLLTLQNQLELVFAQPEETTRQVQAPVLVGRSRRGTIYRNVLTGLVLGAILGMLPVLAARERHRRL